MAQTKLEQIEFSVGVILHNRKGERITDRVITPRVADIWVDESVGVIAVGPKRYSIHSPFIISWTPLGATGVAAKKLKSTRDE